MFIISYLLQKKVYIYIFLLNLSIMIPLQNFKSINSEWLRAENFTFWNSKVENQQHCPSDVTGIFVSYISMRNLLWLPAAEWWSEYNIVRSEKKIHSYDDRTKLSQSSYITSTKRRIFLSWEQGSAPVQKIKSIYFLTYFWKSSSDSFMLLLGFYVHTYISIYKNMSEITWK